MNLRSLFAALFKKIAGAPHRPLPGSSSFFLGANLPWMTYGCDFGANAWFPLGGISRTETRESLSECFRMLAEHDVRLVRWFMLCDGRAGLRFESDNLSLDEFVFQDLDVAVQTAALHQIKIMFALFDFHW